jgi:ferric-dicitrate binding protein FerR (iron transport regulator)
MSKLISEQAAEWLVSIRAGRLTSAERLEYVRWLKQSPAHVRAMLELASLEGLLRRANLSGIPPTQGSSGPPNEPATVVDLIPRRDRAETPSEERRRATGHHWKFAAPAWLCRLVGICP